MDKQELKKTIKKKYLIYGDETMKHKFTQERNAI